jgi:hypothetical protein
MQKALELMNVKLTHVLRDITGETGMGIIRSILAGTMDPETLLQYRHKGCKYGDEDFVKALTGNYRRVHLFALQQAVDLYDPMENRLPPWTVKWKACMSRCNRQPPSKKCPQRRHNPTRGNGVRIKPTLTWPRGYIK